MGRNYDILNLEAVLNQLWSIGVSPTPAHEAALQELIDLSIEWRQALGGTDTLDAEWLRSEQIFTSRGARTPLEVMADPALTDEAVELMNGALSGSA